MPLYFGKPQQCYKCHVDAVYNSWKKMYEKRIGVIRNLCDYYHITYNRFKAASLLTVAFHDAGKPSKSFQQSMSKIAMKNGQTIPYAVCSTCGGHMELISANGGIPRYRHEIISGFATLLLCSRLDDLLGGLEGGGFPFEFFAVIGHHKPVNPDSFRREWDSFFDEKNELKLIGYGETEWNFVTEVARGIFKNEGLPLFDIKWEDINKGASVVGAVKEEIDTVPMLLQDIIDEKGELRVIGQIRETLALLKSLLIASDWEGSYQINFPKHEMHSAINLPTDRFWEKVKEEIEKEPGKTFQIRKFQQDLAELNGHGIAIAPTGSGKTEGAMAWALANKISNGKVLYVLPNQVLTNSIYERLAKYFGQESVGVLHSAALLYQVLNRVESNESEQSELRDLTPTEDERGLHILNRMMFRPIMVATVDQLLMVAFNGNKRWSVIMGEIMGGSIIFDEIHAYDGHMLALLERITREVRQYTRMLFMSATMPQNLIDFLTKLSGIQEDWHIVKDVKLLQKARNRFVPVVDKKKRNFKPLIEKGKLSQDVMRDIDKFIANGKRVAIVCNTVGAAQSIYAHLEENKNLKNKTKMCLHSRFIAKDRRNKERTLEKDRTRSRNEQSWPLILVSTQVIECGMDIDYDVLFTEGAPLEAIIQRAGRINRERGVEKGRVYIFKQDEPSQRFYPPEITNKGLEILETKCREDGEAEITEQEFIEMIERVYKDKKFEEDLRFLNTRRVLDDLIYDIGAVQDLPETDLHTRFIPYKMIEVIPEALWDSIKDESQFVIMEHQVKMPLWAYLKTKSTYANDNWKVMKMKYDTEIGGTFDEALEISLKNEVVFA